LSINKIKDPYMRIVAPCNLLIKLMHEAQSATWLPIERTRKV